MTLANSLKKKLTVPKIVFRSRLSQATHDMMQNTFTRTLASLTFAAGISQAQTIIYQDDFSGGTGNLAGEAPDVRLEHFRFKLSRIGQA